MMELMAEDQARIEADSGVILSYLQDAGGDADESWALVDSEVEKARIFRHAVPEAVGVRLDAIRSRGYPAVKMASDLTRPDLTFSQTIKEYRRDIKQTGLQAIIFGHAQENHLHVNFLPQSEAESRRAAELIGRWMELSQNAGGKLFAEHGVGKIKKKLFIEREREEKIKALKIVKNTLDPHGLFNRGNLFDQNIT
jgi:D-lactate dehydrogenase (cytochrome)